MDLLKGIKVVSFNHFLAGPVAAQLLGDMGADVIALEPIDGAFQRNWAVANHFVDGQSVNLLATGRNKRSLAVDLKSDDGKAIVRRLIASADVVMENFRPGAMARLGFDPDDLRCDHPRLIYAAATGFGATGPYSQRPGQDLLLQAMSGLAAHTGRSDGPPTPVGSVIIDHHAAALYVAGIVAALFARERTGQGRRVDVNLLQAAVDLQGESITAWLNGAPHDSPRGVGGVASWFSPGAYGIHQTRDGYLALSMARPADLAPALDIPELASFSDGDSFARRDEITSLVAEQLKTATTEEWVPKLERARIWHAVVEDYDGLRRNPQLEHLKAFETVGGPNGTPMTLVSHPIKYDGETPAIKLQPQPLGTHTREILGEIGYGAEEIEAFVKGGCIRCHESSSLAGRS